MSQSFNGFKDRVVLFATLEAKPGKADDLQRYLTAIRKFSSSDDEPGCLTYRTSRAGDKFAVFEEYADAAAIEKHFEGEQFKALVAAGPEVALGAPVLSYYEEFASQ